MIEGYKANCGGRQRWLVSASSLKDDTVPGVGFLLDLPGPGILLKKTRQ
jgi:hypothetical protein